MDRPWPERKSAEHGGAGDEQLELIDRMVVRRDRVIWASLDQKALRRRLVGPPMTDEIGCAGGPVALAAIGAIARIFSTKEGNGLAYFLARDLQPFI